MKHGRLISALVGILMVLALAVSASAADPAGEVVTRGDFLDALYTMSGETAEGSQNTFTDVPEEGGIAEAVRWALDHGVVNGYGGGLFGPDDPVTREQAAAMIYRYAQSLNKGFSGMWMFPLDAPDAAEVSGYADEAMHWAVMNDILVNTEDGLKPRAALRDYELVPVLSRVPKALGREKLWYAFADVGLAVQLDSSVTAVPIGDVFSLKFLGQSSRLYAGFFALDALGLEDMEALRAYAEENTLEDAEIVDKGNGARYVKVQFADGTPGIYAVGSDGGVYCLMSGANTDFDPELMNADVKEELDAMEASVRHFLDVPEGEPKLVVTAKWNTPDYTVLVNKQNELPGDWEEHLDIVSTTNSLGDPVEVERNAYRAYLGLKAELEEEGVKVDLDSAYRSVSEQQRIMDDFTEEYGADYAAKTVAKPGFSEHHTGLALDLYLNIDGEDVYYNEDMIQYPDVWARIHAKLADYGFILRYTEGMEHVTGYGYEPWHIRYVGSAELAHEIEASGKTLEAFLGAANDTVVIPQLGESKLYTEEELTEAAVQVKCRFAFWTGCELHSLRYAGDECNSEENLKWANEISPDAGYVEVAEFLTDFHSPVEAYGAWEEDREYTDYQWWLGRTEDGGWDLFSWGY